MIIDFGNKGGGGSAKLEEKNFTITQNGDTPIVPSEGFDGIFQGTITTNVQPKLQEKKVDINGNGTTTIVPEQGYYGISKVTVNTKVEATGSSLDITGTGWESEPFFPVDLSRTASLNDDIEYTRTKFAEWNPSNTSFGLTFHQTVLVYLPKIDTSNVIDMADAFAGSSRLAYIPQLNTSKVTTMNSCFINCYSLKSIPLLDTSNVTDWWNCFQSCDGLISIPQLDASQAKSFGNSCFYKCKNLTHLGGFTGLKKGTSLKDSPKLTKQSLLNVIAGLGQADPAFEAQPKLTLGSDNLAKLTPEEIAVGTAKGWQIVA